MLLKKSWYKLEIDYFHQKSTFKMKIKRGLRFKILIVVQSDHMIKNKDKQVFVYRNLTKLKKKP